MSKVIKRLNAYGMGGTFDQPGYEYDPVNDTFKDLETGKVFSKDYVAPTSGTGTGTSTVKLETNKEVSITANGEIEITPTSGKDAMEKVTANVAVPVPVLESNKTTTIDVSQYTEPVEITPTSGKDGMEKTTVTLTNIPSPSGAIATYDADMEIQDDSGVNYNISQVGKYYCFIDNISTPQLRQIQGDGTTSIQDLLSTFEGYSDATWIYCGTCGDYGFYYPYNG